MAACCRSAIIKSLLTLLYLRPYKPQSTPATCGSTQLFHSDLSFAISPKSQASRYFAGFPTVSHFHFRSRSSTLSLFIFWKSRQCLQPRNSDVIHSEYSTCPSHCSLLFIRPIMISRVSKLDPSLISSFRNLSLQVISNSPIRLCHL